MTRIRIAVIGVGHLGRHHARLLLENPEVELVGVADTRPEALAELQQAHGVRGWLDYRELVGQVDAACVVVPTSHHHEVAGFLLDRGIDVLVEKPIAATSAEGEDLVERARVTGRVLQVGHIERFNAALRAIESLDLEPRYVEAHRLGILTFRSMDIGVVLDLMIHDLDLVLALIRSPLIGVEAYGGALFTHAEDIASAILKFENGAVAHLTANRVALQPMRRMRIFSKSAYASLDFHKAEGTIIRKRAGWDLNNLDLKTIDPSRIGDLSKFVFEGLLDVQRHRTDESNALRDEIAAFLTCVRTRAQPLVSGQDGVAAVALAERIVAAIRQHRW